MAPRTFKKWEIYWANFGSEDKYEYDPKFGKVIGHEQGGRRSVIILNENQAPEMVLVVPCTGQLDKELYKGLPCILLKKEHSGMNDNSMILMHQVRPISIERISSSRVGYVNNEEIKRKITLVWNNML